MEIIPAILGKTPAEIHQQIEAIGTSAKVLHMDVMDGHFVPEITPSDPLKLISPSHEYDFHLMANDPLAVINKATDPHFRYFFVHAELPKETLDKLWPVAQKLNLKIGLAIRPDTPFGVLNDYQDHVKAVLVMTVNPGDSGRPFDSSAASKVSQIKKFYPDWFVVVDGGIDQDTLPAVSDADAVVIHSAIFNSPLGPQTAFHNLQHSARQFSRS